MTEETKLYTDRLIVRTPSANDANDVFELMKDRETALITGFTPMGDISEAEGKIRQSITNESMFVITTKENPEHTIGIFEFYSQKVSTTQGDKQHVFCLK